MHEHDKQRTWEDVMEAVIAVLCCCGGPIVIVAAITVTLGLLKFGTWMNREAPEETSDPESRNADVGRRIRGEPSVPPTPVRRSPPVPGESLDATPPTQDDRDTAHTEVFMRDKKSATGFALLDEDPDTQES